MPDNWLECLELQNLERQLESHLSMVVLDARLSQMFVCRTTPAYLTSANLSVQFVPISLLDTKEEYRNVGLFPVKSIKLTSARNYDSMHRITFPMDNS